MDQQLLSSLVHEIFVRFWWDRVWKLLANCSSLCMSEGLTFRNRLWIRSVLAKQTEGRKSIYTSNSCWPVLWGSIWPWGCTGYQQHLAKGRQSSARACVSKLDPITILPPPTPLSPSPTHIWCPCLCRCPVPPEASALCRGTFCCEATGNTPSGP